MAPPTPPPGGRSVIDALILYTPGAVKRAGGVNAIESWIHDAAARANGNLARSAVKASFRVVHMDEAKGYRGAETVRPAFDHLADPHDGVLDEAATLRNKYGADIVTTIVRGYDPKDAVAGLASYPENPKNPATRDEIWSVVAANQLWTYVLAHEWGHLLGLNHDWKTSPDKNPYYPDNHAYVAPNSAFVTIMGYPSSCRTPCPYAGFYANPHLTYDGQPLGVALGAGRPSADNTRVMNLTAPQVAAYRKPKVALPGNHLAIAAEPPIGGTVRPQAEGPYDPGDLVAVKAVAARGYHFTGWTLDGNSLQETRETLHLRMNGNRALVARFAPGSGPASRVVAAGTPRAGGRVTLRAAGPGTDGMPQLLAIATPARGYSFTGWLVDGHAAGDDPRLAVAAIGGRHTVTARFAPAGRRHAVKMTVVPEGAGRIFLSGGEPSSAGADIIAQARPARGYAFSGWQLGGQPIGDAALVAALTVSGGEQLTAIFRRPLPQSAPPRGHWRS